MSASKKFLSLDSRGPWSFIGLILGAVALVLTIYLGWFYNSEPQVEIQVLSKTKILDVKEPVDRLDIFYDSISLTRTNQSLEVIVVRVVNTGAQAISIDDYDPASPLGFFIDGGNLIQVPKIINSSNSYLSSLDRIGSDYSKGVFLKPTIFNGEDFLTVKLLVISSLRDDTKVIPTGVIAGAGEPRLLFFQSSEDIGSGNTKLGIGILAAIGSVVVFIVAFTILWSCLELLFRLYRLRNMR